jgi:hypothetical protein
VNRGVLNWVRAPFDAASRAGEDARDTLRSHALQGCTEQIVSAIGLNPAPIPALICVASRDWRPYNDSSRHGGADAPYELQPAHAAACIAGSGSRSPTHGGEFADHAAGFANRTGRVATRKGANRRQVRETPDHTGLTVDTARPACSDSGADANDANAFFNDESCAVTNALLSWPLDDLAEGAVYNISGRSARFPCVGAATAGSSAATPPRAVGDAHRAAGRDGSARSFHRRENGIANAHSRTADSCVSSSPSPRRSRSPQHSDRIHPRRSPRRHV